MKRSSSKVAASKPKSTVSKKQPTVTKSAGRVRVDVDKDSSIQVREIENGFIVSESGMKGKGKNSQYYSKEYFSSTNPVNINLPKSPMRLSGKKR